MKNKRENETATQHPEPETMTKRKTETPQTTCEVASVEKKMAVEIPAPPAINFVEKPQYQGTADPETVASNPGDGKQFSTETPTPDDGPPLPEEEFAESESRRANRGPGNPGDIPPAPSPSGAAGQPPRVPNVPPAHPVDPAPDSAPRRATGASSVKRGLAAEYLGADLGVPGSGDESACETVEAAILGACLTAHDGPGQIWETEVAPFIEQTVAEEFSNSKHTAIFRVIKELHGEGNHPLPATLIPILMDRKLLEISGGSAEVSALPEKIFSLVEIARLKQEFTLHSTRRKLLEYADLTRTQLAASLPRPRLMAFLDRTIRGLEETRLSMSNGESPLLGFHSVDSLLQYVPRVDDYLVGGADFQFLPRGMLSAISGDPGIGKSRSIIYFAIASLTGGNFWGQPVRKGVKSLVVTDETTISRLHSDMQAAKRLGYDLSGLIEYAIPEGVMDFKDPRFVRELQCGMRRFQPDCIWIDNFTRLSPTEEKKEFSDTLRSIERACLGVLERNPAVGLVCHNKKPERAAPRSYGRGDADSISGHRCLTARVRGAVILHPYSDAPDDARRVVCWGKSNDSKAPPRSAYIMTACQFDPIPFDKDAEAAWNSQNTKPSKHDRATETVLELAETRFKNKSEMAKEVARVAECSASLADKAILHAARNGEIPADFNPWVREYCEDSFGE